MTGTGELRALLCRSCTEEPAMLFRGFEVHPGSRVGGCGKKEPGATRAGYLSQNGGTFYSHTSPGPSPPVGPKPTRPFTTFVGRPRGGARDRTDSSPKTSQYVLFFWEVRWWSLFKKSEGVPCATQRLGAVTAPRTLVRWVFLLTERSDLGAPLAPGLRPPYEEGDEGFPLTFFVGVFSRLPEWVASPLR